MKKIGIFASGNGSNAENITHYFKDHKNIEVVLFLTNNPNAGVISRGKSLGLESIIFNRSTFYNTKQILSVLQEHKIDLIVLAGFMWLVPTYLIQAYPKRILNIHPALLPKYGGKGMYGDFVHQAVSAAKETQTGISIHYVNEKYDDGAIISQKTVDIKAGEDPASIATKVHSLEYAYFPITIEQVLEM